MSKTVLITDLYQNDILCKCNTLVKMLRDNGYSIHIAARQGQTDIAKIAKIADKVFDVAFDDSTSLLKNRQAYKQLKQIIKNGEYDFIHSFTATVGLFTQKAVKSVNSKNAVTIYTADPFSFCDDAAVCLTQRHLASCCNRIITLTETDYDKVNGKVDSSVYRVHGIGQKTDEFYQLSDDKISKLKNELGFDTDDKIILAAAKNPKKDSIEDVINAMTVVTKDYSNCKLVILDDCQYQPLLKQLVASKNLDDMVRFVPNCDRKNDYMNIADCFVDSGKCRKFHCDILSAMLCGTAVVANNNCVCRELVVDNETGFLVDTSKTEELADAIIRTFIIKDFFTAPALEIASAYKEDNVYNELKDVYFCHI